MNEETRREKTLYDPFALACVCILYLLKYFLYMPLAAVLSLFPSSSLGFQAKKEMASITLRSADEMDRVLPHGLKDDDDDDDDMMMKEQHMVGVLVDILPLLKETAQDDGDEAER